MGTPNPHLMALYGTESDYKLKKAGKLPLSLAVGVPLAGLLLMNMARGDRQEEQEETLQESDHTRMIEAMRNAGDNAALRGEALKVAEATGRALAKTAGIGGLLGSAGKAVVGAIPGIGRSGSLKSKALTAAAGIGGAYALTKGIGAASNTAGAPAAVKVQGAGPGLPRYVNQFGVPTP